ncbi:MAG: hypothetical protein JWP77_2632 [Polaromonas sp.]|jgi:benzoate-CoA ligase family protein|nr:hypothetical protein [Polaromonas sp.]
MNNRMYEMDRVVRSELQGNVVDYLFEHSLRSNLIGKAYLRSPDRDISFGQLYQKVCQAGNFLKSLGVQPGDRVIFSLRDGIEFPALFLGAMKIGAIALPINTFLLPSDYAYYIKDSGAKVIVVDHSLVEAIDQIRLQATQLEHLFVVGGEAEGYIRWETACAVMPVTLESYPRSASDVGFWLYSSGSTGEPKGVIHTHGHIFWATELFASDTLNFSLDDVILCPPKMFFAFGIGFQVYFPIRCGATVLTESGPIKPTSILDKLIRHRPTVFVGVPTLYSGILEQMRAIDTDVRLSASSRLRRCICGGEVLPPALFREWQLSTGAEILDGVGTTEMTHMFLLNRPGNVVPGSCGKLVEGYTARLLGEDLIDVPEGEVGNLFVVGPTAAQEYWNKPERTAKTMFNGGVLTGDKCYRDADGNYFYVGRVDDMLRVGGIWVSPAEVESCLAEHVSVRECAVIGVPDEHGMIKPKAYVVLRKGQSVSDTLVDSMREHMRARLAHIKCPRWFEIITDLPKTATGKIQRFRLRSAEASTNTTAP